MSISSIISNFGYKESVIIDTAQAAGLIAAGSPESCGRTVAGRRFVGIAYNCSSAPNESAYVKDLRQTALNIFDLRDQAHRRLPRGEFDFIDRGCEDDVAIRHNREAIERIKLRPRVLVDVSARDQVTTLFGKPQAMPLAIAPTDPAGMMWYRGEIETARAAAKMGIPFTLASPVGLNVYIMAKVAPEVPVGRIFQGVMPFFFTALAVLAQITAFPDLVTWLPSHALRR